ncbi:MAG: hypothetical protein II208_02550 [Alphaproteobacteria bacterium]|nr:hypothetical protein [Alphaproteobacteria bacterium]
MAKKTAKKVKQNTSAFTIAHYILLFLVSGLCISIIAWIIITRDNKKPTNNVSENIIHVKNTDPCVQRINDIVARMWAFNPDAVPEKYWKIATNYLNQPITTRTYGLCQDVAFICHAGQIRRDCDPCAVPAARTYAMDIHINDLIHANCVPESQKD